MLSINKQCVVVSLEKKCHLSINYYIYFFIDSIVFGYYNMKLSLLLIGDEMAATDVSDGMRPPQVTAGLTLQDNCTK